MEVAVQRIRTSWTKQSRGGPAATVRNSAPTAFRLPSTTLPLMHDVKMSEAEGFTAEFGTTEPADRGVRLDEQDGRLRVFPEVAFAMPPRHRRPAVRLEPGQWIRWHLNYRTVASTCNGLWVYELHTFNIAYGTVARDTFLGIPTRVVNELGSLR
jgi:hypothetical protein